MNISADAVEYVVVHTDQGDIVVRVDNGIVEDDSEVNDL
jgi:hypothetical protein|tara:strand:+ start:2640 stop:2756 length:117 start_codon:yes stop_codon:yes gene_type:complete